MRCRPTVLLIAGFVLAGCTTSGPGTRESTPRSSPTSVAQAYDVPVAIVTHLSADVEGLTSAQARELLGRGTDNWAALGGQRGSLRLVTAGVAEARTALPTAPTARAAVSQAGKEPDTVAIVPATAVTPRVRALTVDGVDPLREPEEYPLLTKASGRPGPVLVTTVVGDIMLGRRVGASFERRGTPRPCSARFRSGSPRPMSPSATWSPRA